MAIPETYVLFDLAGTAYALPSRVVHRMEMLEQVTPVPNAPAFVDGVVFTRGRVVPAVNLRRRFGFPSVAYDMRTRLIVIEHGERTVGLVVDSAREFVAIPDDAIQAPPEGLGSTSGNYLRGIATHNGKVILILDANEILSNTAGTYPAIDKPDK